MRIFISKGDIIKSNNDAIVHVIGPSFLTEGMNSDFYSAGGPELYRACTTMGICMTGQSKITKGYDLPAKYVIHTHAPMYLGGKHNEALLMEKCYRSCLKLAEQYRCASVAFPPLGTDSYRFPPTKAAEIALPVLLDALADCGFVQRIDIICNNDLVYNAFSKKLAALSVSFNE